MKKQLNIKEVVTRDKIFPRLCIIPSLAGVMVFFLIPFCVVIFYSFVDNPISKSFVFSNNGEFKIYFFENFKGIVKNTAFRKAANNTLTFSLVSVPLAISLSLLLAMLLDCKIRFVSQFRTSFLCPLMVPVASVVLIWQVIFHYNGAVNQVLASFGIEKIDWLKSKYGLIVIVLLFLWKNLGYNMILFLSALNQFRHCQVFGYNDGSSYRSAGNHKQRQA